MKGAKIACHLARQEDKISCCSDFEVGKKFYIWLLWNKVHASVAYVASIFQMFLQNFWIGL